MYALHLIKLPSSRDGSDQVLMTSSETKRKSQASVDSDTAELQHTVSFTRRYKYSSGNHCKKSQQRYLVYVYPHAQQALDRRINLNLAIIRSLQV